MAGKIIARGVLAGMGILMFLAPAIRAGEIPTLEPGAKTRLTVKENENGTGVIRKTSGTVIEAGHESITLKEDGTDTPLVVPREDILILETRVQEGRKIRGTLIGLGVGGAMGAVVGYSGGDDPPGIMSMSAGAKAGVGAVVFGLLGAIFGAVASPGERWQTVPTQDVQIGFAPGPRGETGISLAWRF